MEVKLTISAGVIASLMTSAIESRDPVTAGWCRGIYLRGVWEKRIRQLGDVWYSNPKLYAGEFTIEVFEVKDENKEPKGRNLKKHRVNQDDFAKGFAVMAKKFPSRFAQVLEDNTDAPCADAFLQALLFGKEKYA